ncbi:MAG TPA: ATP-binding protein [Actinomycetota bacterium]|nr:ATP-binding protein [Actinomycetota bacterium]
MPNKIPTPGLCAQIPNRAWFRRRDAGAAAPRPHHAAGRRLAAPFPGTPAQHRASRGWRRPVTEIRREFPPTPVAPRLARQALDGWLSEMVGSRTADDVRTVATELIGNAVRHGRLEEDDRILVSGMIDEIHDVVRIEVEQPTPITVAMTDRLTSAEESGMGLRIVDGIATQWGLVEGPPGVAWFEVDR